MSRKEVPRAGLVKMVLAGKATNAQGAAALGVSPRHVQRLKARFQVAEHPRPRSPVAGSGSTRTSPAQGDLFPSPRIRTARGAPPLAPGHH